MCFLRECGHMKLVLPSKKYEKEYLNLVRSASKNGDISEMGNAYRENEKYDDLLIRLKNRRNGFNISKREVPSSLYFIVEKNKIVGTIDLRSKLNDDYFSRLGHIAYYIKPEERNKGYATIALNLALNKYKKNKINNILITCLKENEFSKKVILNNGGIFEKEFLDKITNKIIERYWINLNNN